MKFKHVGAGHSLAKVPVPQGIVQFGAVAEHNHGVALTPGHQHVAPAQISVLLGVAAAGELIERARAQHDCCLVSCSEIRNIYAGVGHTHPYQGGAVRLALFLHLCAIKSYRFGLVVKR